ncbi:MAG: hypothetical protein JWP15_1871 [Alphaproteobacteria bacterium]|nr:hypothetical protein [Alphaproteobacteria bacterium]
MVGRNFWVAQSAQDWEVRQEGLPDKTTRHASRDEAWIVANQRARDCHGEVFFDDGAGGHSDYACYRELPRKMKD